jgi:hypothetical protein
MRGLHREVSPTAPLIAACAVYLNRESNERRGATAAMRLVLF